MIEQPVTIPSHGELLVGDLCRGSNEAVLLLPGWGGTRYGPQRILVEAAWGLAEAGFTTLRLDVRGRGDSTGDPTATTLDDMIADAIAAAEWLRTEQGIGRIHLAGICSGGNVALGAASLLADVGHVVCWSLLPFMEHKAKAAKQGTPRGALLMTFARKLLRPETWKKLLRGEANVRGAVQTLAKDKEGDDAERQRKTSARDILADLRGFQGHLHLLYGGRDPEAAGSRAFFEAWCARHRIPVDAYVIEGAPHTFYTAAWTEAVVARTVEWVRG